MALTLDPIALLEVSYAPVTDDLQVSQPVCWHTFASQVNLESGSSVEGRYVEASGEIMGSLNYVIQDTYISGSGHIALSQSGRTFSALSGGWRDDWLATWSGKYGCEMPDGTNGVSFELVDTDTSEAMQSALIVIQRGLAPVAGTHRSTAIYAYLELNYGSTTGAYRIALEWGRPIRLDYQAEGSEDWQGVAIARDLGNLETYLANNHNEIRFHVLPDSDRNILWLEIGNGNWLKHSPPRPRTGTDPNATGSLPGKEQYRLTGLNGRITIEVYPIRFDSASVTKAPRPMGRTVPNLSEAKILANGGGRDNGQTVDGSVEQDSDGYLSYTATASFEDAGEGLGSLNPATVNDITAYIPSVWLSWNPLFPVPDLTPYPLTVHEVGVWDDIARIGYTSAQIYLDNAKSWFSGNFGNYSCNLMAGNGITIGQRLRGVLAGGGGIQTMRMDPFRLAKLNAVDFTYKLGRPLADEVTLDGWCLYAAIHHLLDIGQIAPKFRLNIPEWAPGKASSDCPYPILGRGTGNNPLYRYAPDRSVMSVLLELLPDAGIVDPVSGINVPIFFNFDVTGQANFAAWDPRLQPIVRGFTDYDPTGANQIWGPVQVYDSVEHMRTEITFQGQDPYTGELLNMYRDLSGNLPWVGWRYPWVERNSRWVSQAYLERLADAATVMASLPQQVIVFTTAFDPNFYAGQTFYLEEGQALNRSGLFVATIVENHYGMADPGTNRGEQICYSVITARAAENLLAY